MEKVFKLAGYYFYKIYYKYVFNETTEIKNAERETTELTVLDVFNPDISPPYDMILKYNIYRNPITSPLEMESIISNNYQFPSTYDYIIKKNMIHNISEQKSDNYIEYNFNTDNINTDLIINANKTQIDNKVKIELESEHIDFNINKQKVINFYKKITGKTHSFEYIYNLDFKKLYDNMLNNLYKQYPFILKIHCVDYPVDVKIDTNKIFSLVELKQNDFKVISSIDHLIFNLNILNKKKIDYSYLLNEETKTKIITTYEKIKPTIDKLLEEKINEKIITFIKINVIEDQKEVMKTDKNDKNKYYNDHRFNVKINTEKTQMLLGYNDNMETDFNYSKRSEYNNNKKNKKFDNTYLLGNFTKIFLPHETNEVIIKNTHIQNVMGNIIKGKPVFLFGYGSSGSGKTSSLIYYRDKEDATKDKIGIIPLLCERICVQLNAKRTDEKMIHISIKVYELIKGKIVHGLDEEYIFQFQNNKDINYLYKINENEDGKYYIDDYNDIKIRNPFRFNGFDNDSNLNLDKEFKKKYFDDMFEFNMETNKYIYSSTNNLAQIITFLVDIDRNVKATNNNPQSSRSHILICIDFFYLEGDIVVVNNRKNLGNIVVGDFAGVENEFLCDNNETLIEMTNLQNTLTKKDFYFNLNDNEEPLYKNLSNIYNNSTDPIYQKLVTEYTNDINRPITDDDYTGNNNIIYKIDIIINYINSLNIDTEIDDLCKYTMLGIYSLITNESKYSLDPEIINTIANLFVKNPIEDKNKINFFKKLVYNPFSDKIKDTIPLKWYYIPPSTTTSTTINIEPLNLEPLELEFTDYIFTDNMKEKLLKYVKKNNNIFNIFNNASGIYYLCNENARNIMSIFILCFKVYEKNIYYEGTEEIESTSIDLHIYTILYIKDDYSTFRNTHQNNKYNIILIDIKSASRNSRNQLVAKYGYNRNHLNDIVITSIHNLCLKFNKQLVIDLYPKIKQMFYSKFKRINVFENVKKEYIILCSKTNFMIDLDNAVKNNHNNTIDNIIQKGITDITERAYYFKLAHSIFYKNALTSYFINLKNYYIAIQKSCNIRVEEGKYINTSLNDLNEGITILIKNYLNPFYNYIEGCDYVYTTNKNNKSVDSILKNEKNILKIVIKHIHERKNGDIYTIIKDLIICVFGVLDFSRTKNNPPPVPYIDLTGLQKALINGDGIITEQRKKLDDQIQKLKRIEMYKSIFNNILKDDPKNSTVKTQLKFIKDISIINSASTMGTLDFFDKIAKLNTTETLCNNSKEIKETDFTDLKYFVDNISSDFKIE